MPPGPMPIAMDGGWGWVVVVGAFVSYFIADGWSYSFGIFFTDLLTYFNQGKGKTALIGALLYGFPLLLSPVACALITSFGCRKIGIIGGFIFGASFVLSAFANSIDVLCISIGIISSVGLSMSYISSLVIVTHYFEKRRGFATGLAVTGSGLGAFAFPPLLEKLIEIYAWRGAFLIVGGIGFNIILASALFRAPPMMTNGDKVQEDCETAETEMHVDDEEEEELDDIPSTKSKRTERPLSLAHKSTDHSKQLLKKQSLSLDDTKLSRDKPASRDNVRLPSSADEEHEVHRLLGEVEKGLQLPVSPVSPSSSPGQKAEEAGAAPDEPAPDSTMALFWQELRTVMTHMMDRSLLVNFPYLLFCASNFMLYLFAGAPFVYLVDKAVGLGIENNDAAFLLSIIGITRTIGQLCLGYVGDSKSVSTTATYAVCITLCGVVTLLVPVFHTYASLCVFSAVYGFFISVTYSLQMMVVVDIVGITKATNAFGLVQLSQGIATLLGTPIAGWLYDATGDYDISFYLAGAWILSSGLTILPLPCITRRWKKSHDLEAKTKVTT